PKAGMSRATLNPELLWIGAEYCYRLNPLADSSPSNNLSSVNQPRQHQNIRPVGQLESESMPDSCYGDDAAEAATCRVAAAAVKCDEIEEQLSGCQIDSDNRTGRYRLRLPIPSAFHKFLIGRHGDAKRRLEAETGVELIIPRMGDTESPVLALGRTKAQLASAKTRIELLLADARDRLPITHFLSISLAAESVRHRYEQFRDSALKWCGGDRGINDGVFQGAARLHVTCAPLLLLTSQEVARAKRLLDEFGRDRLPELMRVDSGPLTVSLSGLEIMNDDTSDTKVLYAQLCEPTGRLQAIANALADQFQSLARAQPGREGVKLHVTLMNARYAADSSDNRQNRSLSFDAAHLLSKFSNFDFGSCQPDSIQLSKSSSGTSKDSYYACEHRIPILPS
uniref:KH domain-containing protein n=2 Tax=Macrostomum lignano TaxID=282301 RepID=A0A1I8HLH6_9PLAT